MSSGSLSIPRRNLHLEVRATGWLFLTGSQDHRDKSIKFSSSFLWKICLGCEAWTVEHAWAVHPFEEAQSIAPNLHLSRWIPQNDLLADRRLIAFITHGGMGSTQELALRGKPGQKFNEFVFFLNIWTPQTEYFSTFDAEWSSLQYVSEITANNSGALSYDIPEKIPEKNQ